MPVQHLSADGLKLVRFLIKKFPALPDDDNDVNCDRVLVLIKYITEAINNNTSTDGEVRTNLEVLGLRMHLELIEINIDRTESPDYNQLKLYVDDIVSLFRGGRTMKSS